MVGSPGRVRLSCPGRSSPSPCRRGGTPLPSSSNLAPTAGSSRSALTEAGAGALAGTCPSRALSKLAKARSASGWRRQLGACLLLSWEVGDVVEPVAGTGPFVLWSTEDGGRSWRRAADVPSVQFGTLGAAGFALAPGGQWWGSSKKGHVPTTSPSTAAGTGRCAHSSPRSKVPKPWAGARWSVGRRRPRGALHGDDHGRRGPLGRAAPSAGQRPACSRDHSCAVLHQCRSRLVAGRGLGVGYSRRRPDLVAPSATNGELVTATTTGRAVMGCKNA